MIHADIHCQNIRSQLGSRSPDSDFTRGRTQKRTLCNHENMPNDVQGNKNTKQKYDKGFKPIQNSLEIISIWHHVKSYVSISQLTSHTNPPINYKVQDYIVKHNTVTAMKYALNKKENSLPPIIRKQEGSQQNLKSRRTA